MLIGHRVAHRIGQVNGRRTGLDGSFDAALEELDRGAGGIHRRPFDVVDEVAGLRHGAGDDLDDLVLGLFHLVRQMDRRGRDEGVDAAAAGMAHSLPCPIDIGRDRASEAGNGSALDLLGHGHDGFEVAIGGNGKTSLDDVDAHLVERFGDLELFLQRHGGAGRLLAVAQGGVEDEDPFFVTIGGGGHSCRSYRSAQRSCLCRPDISLFGWWRNPLTTRSLAELSVIRG